MATRKIKLTGVAQWPKLFEENRDLKGFEGAFEAHEGAYTIDVILSDPEFAKLKDAKSMLKGSKTEDGETKVRFKRKHKGFGDWDSGAPQVFNPDGTVRTFAEGNILNGSIVEVHLSVYDTKRKSIVGTRLDTVKILHLQEWEDHEADKPETDEEIPF